MDFRFSGFLGFLASCIWAVVWIAGSPWFRDLDLSLRWLAVWVAASWVLGVAMGRGKVGAFIATGTGGAALVVLGLLYAAHLKSVVFGSGVVLGALIWVLSIERFWRVWNRAYLRGPQPWYLRFPAPIPELECDVAGRRVRVSKLSRDGAFLFPLELTATREELERLGFDLQFQFRGEQAKVPGEAIQIGSEQLGVKFRFQSDDDRVRWMEFLHRVRGAGYEQVALD